MLWEQYVFQRGTKVQDLWERMYRDRRDTNKPAKILYIAGRGFDVRANAVLEKYVESIVESDCRIEKAELVLVGFSNYQLSEELQRQTDENAASLLTLFERLGTTTTIQIGAGGGEEEDLSAASSLRQGNDELMKLIADQTDIVLDVSSLPRLAYMSFMLALLQRLVKTNNSNGSVLGGAITFQVLVGEDARLDGKIQSEDPSNDLVMIPGFATALQAESMQDWPLVWFPVLGESKIAQLQKVMEAVPPAAEICPVLPHPSKDLRRGDKLLLEYKASLFDSRDIPLTNVMYVHESHPFEAYRQLLRAMSRYQKSMSLLGGCRLVVTPLASKLITLGVALACFEMKFKANGNNYSVAIPNAEPQRYTVPLDELRKSEPEISMMILTGEPYQVRETGI